jgi:hypothetical protein
MAGLVAVPVLCLLTSAFASGLRSEFSLGADYSNQRYTAYTSDTLQGDTADVETEAKGAWRLGLEGPDGPTRLEGSNLLTFSTRSIRDALDLSFDRDLGPRLAVETGLNAEARLYHSAFPSLADTSWRKDYVSGSADAGLRFRPFEPFSLTASDEVEAEYYPEPDSFNYHYVINRVKAGSALEVGLLGSLDADWQWSRRWALSADSQNYDDHTTRLGFDNYIGDNWQIRLSGDLSRRAYETKERSYWDGNPSLQLGFDPMPALGFSLDEDARWTFHDSATVVYSDAFQNRLRVGLEWRPAAELTFRVGPEWERSQTLPTAEADDYRDRAVTIGCDFLNPGRVWVSLDNRVGQRRYHEPDSAYQSNYTFNELNLMLSWTIFTAGRNSLLLDGMAGVTPEWHADQADNFTLTTFSLELKYGF